MNKEKFSSTCKWIQLSILKRTRKYQLRQWQAAESLQCQREKFWKLQIKDTENAIRITNHLTYTSKKYKEQILCSSSIPDSTFSIYFCFFKELMYHFDSFTATTDLILSDSLYFLSFSQPFSLNTMNDSVNLRF